MNSMTSVAPPVLLPRLKARSPGAECAQPSSSAERALVQRGKYRKSLGKMPVLLAPGSVSVKGSLAVNVLTPTNPKQVVESLSQLESAYAAIKEKGLKLDMTRGKPSNEQLDLANELLTALSVSDYKAADGTDTRNYGGLDGLPEMKAIFAELLETTPANVIVGGASSLTM